MRRSFAWCTALVLALAGCGEAPGVREEAPAPAPAPAAAAQVGGGPMTITVTSSAFKDGEGIPKKYTGEGADVSPPLAWEGVPEGTKELALICDDPDAPRPKPWVHWVLYKIPADKTGLAEGDSGGALRHAQDAAVVSLSNGGGAVDGENSKGRTGYNGPMPPAGHGVHHYHFKVYALDGPLSLGPGADKEEVLGAMQGHVLAEGELVGTYERK